jgi:hypothetical protein
VRDGFLEEEDLRVMGEPEKERFVLSGYIYAPSVHLVFKVLVACAALAFPSLVDPPDKSPY